MTHANDNNAPIRFLSVCSGIEAASVAWGPLGWSPVAFSEIEKFPSAVLAHHYPDVPNLGDFTKIDTTTLGRVDILCGGTPCQAFSVAGLRNSLADARGNLTLSFVRLAHELAGIAEAGQPADGLVSGGDAGERQLAGPAGNGLRNVVWENVPGVLNTKDNAFGCFLGALVGSDSTLVPSPKPADGKSNQHWKWRKGGRYPVLDDEGEPTGEYIIREPWHALSWPDAGMVSGPKGRAAWRILDAQYFGLAQRRRRVILVADFGAGADPAAVLFELESVHGNPAPSREARKDIAPTISARTKGGGGLGTDFDLDGGLIQTTHEVSHPLLAKGNDSFDESMQSYVFAPEIARCVATREGSSQDYETTTMVAVGVTGQISHTLKAEGADASEDGTGRGTPIVAQSVAIRGREGGGTAELGGEIATALRASQGGGDKPHVLTSAVRRLTPTECERLMGFPDGYTAIPWRNKPADQCPDGPRYKALGNSWAVPKFHWLGKRIAALMPAQKDTANAA